MGKVLAMIRDTGRPELQGVCQQGRGVRMLQRQQDETRRLADCATAASEKPTGLVYGRMLQPYYNVVEGSQQTFKRKEGWRGGGYINPMPKRSLSSGKRQG
jgi:hypothetical protein